MKPLLLAVALVALAEVGARLAIAPIGAYWEYWTPAAAAKFEKYRADVRHGTVPSLIVVGDSTAARNIDPEQLSDPTGRPSAFNLSWPANFPVAFRECTLPLFRADAVPRLVVASFSPTGFADSDRVQRFEASILSSPYCRQLRGEGSIADRLYLTRLRLALPFRRSWWSGAGLPQPSNMGFMPLTGAQTEPDAGDDPSDFAAERFSAIEELFRTAAARRFEAVIVIPPRLHPSPIRLKAERVYVERLRAAGYRYLDYRDAAFLSSGDFYDNGHLNRQGAKVFTVRLRGDLGRMRS